MICNLTGPYAYDQNVVVLWSNSIADAQAPTDAEMNLATDLMTPYTLTDIIGWEITTDILGDGIWLPQEEERMGEQKLSDCRLGFAAKRTPTGDIRSFWNRGDEGFILILPSGPYDDVPTAYLNVYPVRVAQLSQQQLLRTGGGSTVIVTFAVRARCGENVTVVGT